MEADVGSWKRFRSQLSRRVLFGLAWKVKRSGEKSMVWMTDGMW